MLTHWPNAYFIQRSVLDDHIWPLWNPTQMLGLPFAANPLSGLWYPPGWTVLLLPVLPAINLLLAFHLVLGGLGMQQLVIRLGGRIPAGLAAGLAWSLSPKIWAHLGAGHVGLVYAAGWLPWIANAAVQVCGAENCSREEKIRSGGRLGLLWAAQLLADPRLAAYTAIGLVFFLIGRFFISRPACGIENGSISGVQDCKKLFLPWAASGIFGLGIAAVQWLPLLDYLPFTNRQSLTAGEGAIYSLPISYLLGLVWPDRGGFHEWMTYTGMIVLVLAFLGWLGLDRRSRLGVALSFILLILYVLGENGPLYQLAAALPGAFLLRVPPRAWFLISFGIVLLAGLGIRQMDTIRNGEFGRPVFVRWRRGLNRLAAAVVTAFGVSAAFIVSITGNQNSPALWGFIWLFCGVIIIVLSQSRHKYSSIVTPLLMLLILTELVWFDVSLVSSRQKEQVFYDGAATALMLQEKQGRVYAPSFRPPPQVAAVMGIRIVNGVEPLLPSNYVTFLNAAAGVEGSSAYSVILPPLSEGQAAETALAGANPDPFLLAQLDVKWVVSQFSVPALDFPLEIRFDQESLAIYYNSINLDWPAIFRRVDTVPDFESAMDWIENDRKDSSVVVTGGRQLYGPDGRLPAELLESNPNHLKVKADGPGLLVLSEYYLPGWKATIDGISSPVVAVNGILRGVYLDEGVHYVDFVYRPWSVIVGFMVTCSSLICLLALTVRGFRRGRRKA